MANVSRPLIALLVASVAFLALWLVALKPGSSSSPGGSPGGLGRYQSTINAARGVQAVVNRASAAAVDAGPKTSAAGGTPTAGGRGRTTGDGRGTSAEHQMSLSPAFAARARGSARGSAAPRNVAEQALASGRVLAILFYNPSGADDQAVRRELAAVPTHSGRVVKLAVPIGELADYTNITSQVPITASPTLVLINRSRQASTIVGFADRFEIAQRVSDALAQ